ncbi:MAG: aldehyde dehydrogenase family protein [Rhodospirillaceae bacterium]|nr:aldehyde dehydrogenase family protein [Rhodospirillaceae bacterium]
MTVFDPNLRQIFVDNQYRESSSSGEHCVLNPADLTFVGRIAMCEEQEVENVILRAKIAQNEWKKVDEKSRSIILHGLANSIENGDFEEVDPAPPNRDRLGPKDGQ